MGKTKTRPGPRRIESFDDVRVKMVFSGREGAFSDLTSPEHTYELLDKHRLKYRAWRRFLKGTDCVVLAHPWGLGPLGNVSTFELPGDRPDRFNFGQVHAMVFDPTLWEWAAKSTSTMVWLLPVPTDLADRTGVDRALFDIVQHVLHGYRLRIRTHGAEFHPVGECCIGPRASLGEVLLDASPEVRQGSLIGKKDSHPGWVEALWPLPAPCLLSVHGGPRSGEDLARLLRPESHTRDADDTEDLPKVRGVDDPTTDADSNRENESEDPEEIARNLPGRPPMPAAVWGLRVGSPIPDSPTMGIGLFGRVGQGRIALVPTIQPSASSDLDRLRKAASILHCILHEDLNDLVPERWLHPTNSPARRAGNVAEPRPEVRASRRLRKWEHAKIRIAGELVYFQVGTCRRCARFRRINSAVKRSRSPTKAFHRLGLIQRRAAVTARSGSLQTDYIPLDADLILDTLILTEGRRKPPANASNLLYHAAGSMSEMLRSLVETFGFEPPDEDPLIHEVETHRYRLRVKFLPRDPEQDGSFLPLDEDEGRVVGDSIPVRLRGRKVRSLQDLPEAAHPAAPKSDDSGA
jgi:hypothetical protein